MVTGGQDPGGEYENLQLTTLQGWRQFVTEMRSVPQLLAGPVWSGPEEDKRAGYDDDRIDHHSRLLVVQTPTIREVINSGRRLIQLNKTARYGRCGLIVSGPARTGTGEDQGAGQISSAWIREIWIELAVPAVRLAFRQRQIVTQPEV